MVDATVDGRVGGKTVMVGKRAGKFLHIVASQRYGNRMCGQRSEITFCLPVKGSGLRLCGHM